MLPGLIGAVLAAICYGAASVSQALGVRRFAAAPSELPLLVRLGRARWYVLGTALDLAGFVASWVALRSLPLFLVQSVIATSVAVTAVLARKIFGTALSRSEVVALGMVVVGLGCLAVSGVSSPAHPLSTLGSLVLLLLIVPITLAALVFGRPAAGGRPAADVPRDGARRGWILLATISGLAFGGVGIAARVLATPHPWWHLFGDPAAWALVGYAALGVISYAVALARGPVTMVASIGVVIETTVPAAVGLGWLGDAIRSGFGVVVIVGLLVTIGGCLALCRNENVVDLERTSST